jgi:hypothetical protein
MSKLISTVLVTVLLAGLSAGCGGKLEETYQMVTLREAGHAQIASPGFKFGFDTPDFIAANGDLALVREGNIIEFFTGMDIENKLKQVEGRKFVVGARKMYSPTVHFTVDFFVTGGDTIEVGEPYSVTFPPLVRGFDEGDFEEIEISSLSPQTSKLKDIFNTKFKVEKAVVTYEEVEWRSDPEMAYVLNYPNVRFFINEVTPEMELVLKAFIAENLYFDGGVSYGDRPASSTRNYRTRTKIAGPVDLEYIMYAGNAIPVISQ